jgi:eukaryotic-like serine/threonine-protein kinase
LIGKFNWELIIETNKIEKEGSMPDLTGQDIGRYHIIEKLGQQGGMAIVYRAYDTRLECDEAVKVIWRDEVPSSQHDKMLKRFEREAKAMARLLHPNIVKATDFGEIEGSPYLVMPFVPGQSLKRVLIGKPMPWMEAVRLVWPVAQALAYAH